VSAIRGPFLTVPRLEAVAGLVHGFGRAGWSETDLASYAATRRMTPVIMRQLHSDVIHRLDAAPARELEGDALITDVPGLLLVVRTADCLPALLLDEAHSAVAAVHCGWRGTERRILEKAVRAMGEAYGSQPGEMLAVLGPCIGPACYEVGPEVRDGFLRACFPETLFAPRGDVPEVQAPLLKPKYLLDLPAANVYLLDKAGVKRENIIPAGPVCTHCEPRLLSYRRNPHDPRRMSNFIGLSS
jgi:YfiH family protein